MTEPQQNRPGEEPPPILGTWPRLYAVVLGFLAFLIVVFELIERAFS